MGTWIFAGCSVKILKIESNQKSRRDFQWCLVSFKLCISLWGIAWQCSGTESHLPLWGFVSKISEITITIFLLGLYVFFSKEKFLLIISVKLHFDYLQSLDVDGKLREVFTMSLLEALKEVTHTYFGFFTFVRHLWYTWTLGPHKGVFILANPGLIVVKQVCL